MTENLDLPKTPTRDVDRTVELVGQSDRHAQVIERDKTDLAGNWEEVVKIGEEYQGHHKDVLEILEEFKSMWDGHLGTVRVTRHRIELEEGAQPVFQSLYRSFRRQREL